MIQMCLDLKMFNSRQKKLLQLQTTEKLVGLF
jgi:hypothetical protein